TGRHTNPYCYHTHIETDPHSAARHVSMECIVLWTVKLQEVSYPWGGQAWWFTHSLSNTQTHKHTHTHTHTHRQTHRLALSLFLPLTHSQTHTHTHPHPPTQVY